MDDSTWIGKNKNELKIILQIADSFNEYNGIKVNKDKSELLVHQPEADEQETLIELNFGSDIIKVTYDYNLYSISFIFSYLFDYFL